MLIVGFTALREWGVKVDNPSVDMEVIGTLEAYSRYILENSESIISHVPISNNKFLVTHKREYFSAKLMEWEIAFENSSAAMLLSLIKERPSLVKRNCVCPEVVYVLHREEQDFVPNYLKELVALRKNEIYNCTVGADDFNEEELRSG